MYYTIIVKKNMTDRNTNREEKRLDTNYLENNYLTLVGEVTGEKCFSHEMYGEKFYTFELSVSRLSGSEDVIPITISERLFGKDTLTKGNKLLVKGQFRSYNSHENERNRLILTVFAKDIVVVDEDETTINEVVLIGHICKAPIYRETPFGREITDLLLAVNRAYNKSDYIPAITWGRTARFCSELEIGTKVKIIGRVQSRQYEKKLENDIIETRVAYEISTISLEVINDTE